MGRRGPPPIPTALKLERGNPGKRALNRDEPEFAPLGEACPEELTGRARAEWNRLAPDLRAKGLLTVGGRATFVTLCHLGAEIEALRRLIAKTARRDPMRLPWEKLLNNLRTQQRQHAAEFGLTPARAASVKAVKPPPTPSAFARIVGQGPLP